MPIRLIAAVVLLSSLQIAVHAQDSNGTIQGVIRDVAGNPVAGAQVRASSDSVTVTTDAGPDGAYIFTDVPPGDYRVQVTDADGRILSTTSVRLAAGGITQTVNFSVRTGGVSLGGAASEPSRFYAGKVGITPSVSLSPLGTDTNVFNVTQSEQRDTTFTLTPQAAVALDTSLVRGEGTARVDYQYFNKLTTERSLNGNVAGGIEVPLGRLTPWVDGAFDGGQRRIDHEIDLRAQHSFSDVRVGADVRVTTRTVASASVNRSDFGFDPAEVFLGSNLQELLNRRGESVRFEVRQEITPSMVAVGRVTAMRDRFRFAPQRDADFGIFEGGINTGTRTITGTARVGYVRLDRVHQGISNYRGLVASVDELFLLGERTRLHVLGSRDIVWSIDPAFPYYLRLGAVADLLAALSDRWDVSVRAGGEQMRHEPVAGFGFARYHDTYGTVGADLGVHIVPDVRVGAGFAREERDSPRHDRNFIGYRYGLSVTVGAPPIVRIRSRE